MGRYEKHGAQQERASGGEDTPETGGRAKPYYV